MKKILFPVFIFCALTFVAGAAQTEATPAPAVFAENGFSIVPPKAKVDLGVPVIFALPAKDGFAPNVNVLIQDWDKSIAEYAEFSVSQIKEMKGKIILQKNVSDNECVLEYRLRQPEGKMQFYARAVARGKKVYLVTGTALEKNWGDSAKLLKECVDSFKLTSPGKTPD